jgi:hypothetical protein
MHCDVMGRAEGGDGREQVQAELAFFQPHREKGQGARVEVGNREAVPMPSIAISLSSSLVASLSGPSLIASR